MDVQILVTKPNTLSADDKAALRESGIVVVEAKRPDDVRLLDPHGPAIPPNDMFRAALQALAEKSQGYNGCGDMFVRHLAAMCKVETT